MAASVIGILNSLGLSEESSVSQILSKLIDYNLMTTDELHNIQNISVKPLPNIVRNQADILKQRMYGIATDEDYGLPIVINRRMVLIRYILDKLNIAVDEIIEGNIVVGKATNDENGNNIKETYETKADATSKNSTLNTKVDTLKSELENGTIIVKKVFNDQNGNNIKETYETKADAVEKQANLSSLISTMQEDFEAGNTPVGRAIRDFNDNEISLTYETKLDANTKNANINNKINTLQSNLNSGILTVNKAKNDQYGNKIDETYETKLASDQKLSDANKHTDDKIDELKRTLLGDNYNELYDTFKEISDYIASDKTAAAEMLSKINKNTSDISTNESSITSNFNYISGVETSLSETIERVVDVEKGINALVDDKVDKVEGKQLSTNDLTNELLQLLQDKYTKEETNVLVNDLDVDLQNQIDDIKSILTSDDVDFDTLQELVNALKNNTSSIGDIFTTLNQKEDKSNLKKLAYKDSLSKADVGLGNVRNVEQYSKTETDTLLEEINGAIDNLSGVTGETQIQLSNYYTKAQANILYDEKVDKTTKINGRALSGDVTITKSDISLGNVTNDSQVKRSEMGTSNGVATLDSNGKVPTSQLPSYVDDVIEGTYVSNTTFKNTSGTVITGEAGKIYVDTTTNKTYRWGGSSYVEISASLALGTTSSTAYRGDLGATNATNISTLQKTTTDLSSKITTAQNGVNTNATNISNIINGTTTVGNSTTATMATKLGDKTVGGTTTPIYLNAGVPTSLSYTIAKSVPSDAKFTDTDTGATSVTVIGEGNAVTSASYVSATRKLILTKGTKFLTSHQSLENYSTLANTIKSLSIDGKTITYTKGDNTTGTLTTQDTNTWRGIQDNLTSTSTTESLSANQGRILNEKFSDYLTTSDASATYQPKGNYLTTIPTATTTVSGGVKVGSNITVSSGTISLTKSNVTNALGYTPPTTNTTYELATTTSNGLMSSTDKTAMGYINLTANNTAIGKGTTATGTYAMALGRNATASGATSLAVGSGSATGAYSISLGRSDAKGMYSLSIGSADTIASETGSIAIGGDCVYAKKTKAIAIGIQHSDDESDYDVNAFERCIAIGAGPTAGDYVSGGNVATDAIAIGTLAKSTVTGGVAIGNGAQAVVSQAVAIGANAISSGGVQAISIGANSRGGYSGVAVGTGASGGYYGVAIGTSATASGQRGIAIGAGVTSGSSGSSGYVKIGSTSNPYYYGGSSASWTSSSDIRDKININEINNCQEFINRISPIYYNYNRRKSYSENCSLLDYDKENHEKGINAEENITLGFKAQDVANALQELYGDECFGNVVIHEFEKDEKTGNENDAYFMNNGELIPFLVGALKEQQELIKNLIVRIEKLEQK